MPKLPLAKTYELKQDVSRQNTRPTDSGPRNGPLGRPSGWRRGGPLLLRLLFLATLAAIVYLALVPNVHHDMFRFLPTPLGDWCGTHDDLNNFAAFAVLGLLSFRLGSHGIPQVGSRYWGPWAAAAANRALCLVALLALVCILEVTQIWIPGRHSCLRDVATGWAGVFAGWIFMTVRSFRASASLPESACVAR